MSKRRNRLKETISDLNTNFDPEAKVRRCGQVGKPDRLRILFFIKYILYEPFLFFNICCFRPLNSCRDQKVLILLFNNYPNNLFHNNIIGIQILVCVCVCVCIYIYTVLLLDVSINYWLDDFHMTHFTNYIKFYICIQPIVY